MHKYMINFFVLFNIVPLYAMETQPKLTDQLMQWIQAEEYEKAYSAISANRIDPLTGQMKVEKKDNEWLTLLRDTLNNQKKRYDFLKDDQLEVSSPYRLGGSVALGLGVIFVLSKVRSHHHDLFVGAATVLAAQGSYYLGLTEFNRIRKLQQLKTAKMHQKLQKTLNDMIEKEKEELEPGLSDDSLAIGSNYPEIATFIEYSEKGRSV